MKNILDAKLITALKTPYLENRKIDLDMLDKIVEKQIESGVDGLLIGGTTGEGHLMEWDEHIMLIAHAVHNFSDKVVIIGNTGSNNTYEAIKAAEQGFAVGMDVALQINPYYGKTSEAGLLAHFSKVLEVGPTILYNVPGRTGQDIKEHTIEAFAKNPNLVGVKECAGNDRIGYYEKKGIACWSGDDDQCHDSVHYHGSHGVVSVASNIIPKTMKKLLESPQPELAKKLSTVFNWLFCTSSPIPLNSIMAMMGLTKPVFRLPYVPLSAEIRTEGKRILEELQLDEIMYSEISEIKDEEFLLV